MQAPPASPGSPAGYTVLRVLSAGPLARVALAHDAAGRECVLKTAAVARAEAFLARETAALRAMAAADVRVVPGVLEAWPGGLALERVMLPTLWDISPTLRQSHALRDATARAALAALADVHAARTPAGAPLGMVHGDVSPANVFAADTPDLPRVLLADFGLATWSGAPPLETGPFRGTLAYAAPETARGEPLDGRADDFALAASLLHAATGVALRAVPVQGAGAAALVDAGSRPLDASHPWRTQVRALFDARLADALLACLAFDPRDRPRETPRPW